MWTSSSRSRRPHATLAEALAAPEGTDRTVADVVELPATVTEDASLADALGPLTNAPGTGVPVLGSDGRTMVGWLSHQAVLGRLV